MPLDQTIYFNDGTCREVYGVTKISQGRWFHLIDKDGTEFIVNPDNVTFIKARTVEKDGDPKKDEEN